MWGSHGLKENPETRPNRLSAAVRFRTDCDPLGPRVAPVFRVVVPREGDTNAPFSL